MKNSMIRRRDKGEAAKKERGTSRRGGFTLTEVMFASTISLLLFLTMLETLSVCQRMSSNVKWQLAADAIAYDTVWNKFNEFTTPLEFSNMYPVYTNRWENVPASESSNVWYGGGLAQKNWVITPGALPTSNWVIRACVRWPLPGVNKWATNSYYTIERYWINRKLFKDTD